MPTMFSSVDFPQPEGPITATNSPLSICRLTFASAAVSTLSARYSLRIPLSVITVVLPLQSVFLSFDLDAVEFAQLLVPGRQDALACHEAGEHFDLLRIAAAEAYRATLRYV